MPTISVAGFSTCPFHQQALAAAKKLVAAGKFSGLDDLTCASRDEYQLWLKDSKPALDDARAATHTSSPFVFSGDSFVGGCDDTLALLAASGAGRLNRRLRALAGHVATGATGVASAMQTESLDPPLGSLEGAAPSLRSWTVAQLGTTNLGDVPAEFPEPVAQDHLAVAQFREFGYIAILDAVAEAPLKRIQDVFHKHQPRARAVYDASIAVDEGHQGHHTYSQMYDLPREDMSVGPEAWNSGAWGGYLVTKESTDFDSYMDVLANPQVLPLLMALVGPSIYIAESGARTCIAPPIEKALAEGGYTSWVSCSINPHHIRTI
jgi:glutaredoxin